MKIYCAPHISAIVLVAIVLPTPGGPSNRKALTPNHVWELIIDSISDILSFISITKRKRILVGEKEESGCF